MKSKPVKEKKKTKALQIKQLHEACGFSFRVVGSDGWTSSPNVFRGKKTVEFFVEKLLQVKEKIREKPGKQKTDPNDAGRLGN